MSDLERHFLHLIPSVTSVSKADKNEKLKGKPFPPAKTLSRTNDCCTIELPSPASERGLWKVTCSDCESWAVISVEQSVVDPKSFELPCGKLKVKE